ncbi:MAG: hypothetical protein E3J37_03000 [Anaerolineales bacterium]|nr:MAG: hypothetical protein E3J37_03000 [Anaerolineales bacterium]
MSRFPRGERDLRKYAQTTQIRLIVGVLVILAVVGNGLIWIIFGSDAARMALLCMGISLAPALLIVVCLGLIAWILRMARGD